MKWSESHSRDAATTNSSTRRAGTCRVLLCASSGTSEAYSCHKCRATPNESTAQPWGHASSGAVGFLGRDIYRSIHVNTSIQEIMHNDEFILVRTNCKFSIMQTRRSAHNTFSITVTEERAQALAHSSGFRSYICAAFHLAHYQDDNLSVAVSRPHSESLEPITPFTVWAERKEPLLSAGPGLLKRPRHRQSEV